MGILLLVGAERENETDLRDDGNPSLGMRREAGFGSQTLVKRSTRYADIALPLAALRARDVNVCQN